MLNGVQGSGFRGVDYSDPCGSDIWVFNFVVEKCKVQDQEVKAHLKEPGQQSINHREAPLLFFHKLKATNFARKALPVAAFSGPFSSIQIAMLKPYLLQVSSRAWSTLSSLVSLPQQANCQWRFRKSSLPTGRPSSSQAPIYKVRKQESLQFSPSVYCSIAIFVLATIWKIQNHPVYLSVFSK